MNMYVPSASWPFRPQTHQLKPTKIYKDAIENITEYMKSESNKRKYACVCVYN